MVIYSVIAVLVVVAAVVMMLFNSGILQRSLTALNVNGAKYTAADVQYYYTSLYNEQARQYLFNSAASVKKQVYDEATGQSWYDYLMDQAVQQLTRNTALAQQAEAAGHTLSAEAKASLDDTLAQLETAWISYNQPSRDAFIRANFGSGMTYDRLVSLLNMEYLASDYAQTKLDAIDHSDADYDAYYKEHADEMDTVIYSLFTFRTQVPTTDDEGNTIEMTEAEYEDQLYDSSISTHTIGSTLSLYTSYADWLLESGRKAGDVTVIENGGETYHYYYVVRFEGRELDQEETHTVRHLLVRAGDTSTTNPTQEQFDAAETKARELWDQWKAGEATEESFATLASTTSNDDASSRSTGGLYANITSTSSYVEPFLDWALDSARKEGDVDLVKTEYGWHLMYYVSTNDPVWRQSTTAALQNQDYEQLAESATQGWNISQGMGMKLVKA